MSTRLGFLSAFSSATSLSSLFKGGRKVLGPIAKNTDISGLIQRDKRSETLKINLHSHSIERRRTARVALAVPVTVQGETVANEKFLANSATLCVCGHGGLITLNVPVVAGQTILLIKEQSEQQAKCNIVSVRQGDDRKIYVGIEFVDPSCNFWHMNFTAPGARPLRRVTPIRISA
jgi:hypothetical protein